VRKGEALGIIGPNGAGKSTILKMLSRITAPTSGEITINGRLSALIEVGSGFHPELTGRENVYLSGSILGMRRREIAAKLDQIIDFAGVRRFIDVPVKQYSSGMYVRLGFAISAHLEADILLLDEVLAVGDAEFQARCLERIRELERAGTTIVFISHDLRAVERLCSRALLLERGKIAFEGPPRQAIAEYARRLEGGAVPDSAQQAITAGAEAEIPLVEFVDVHGCARSTFRTGEPLRLRLNYVAHTRVPRVFFEAFFRTPEGHVTCQMRTDLHGTLFDLEPGTGFCELTCDALGMQPGVYSVQAKIVRHNPAMDVAVTHDCGPLRVEPGLFVYGDFYMPHQWRLVQNTEVRPYAHDVTA